MVRYRRPALLDIISLFVLILLLPARLQAFSLGELQVKSSFGEPFLATIPLHLEPEEEASGVESSLAAQSHYQKLHLPWDPIVTQLQVQSLGRGKQREIRLLSSQPIRVPVFNILLQNNSGVGSHFRHFPVVLALAPGKSTPRPAADPQHYGPVKKGDTLASIARERLPADLPLRQRMVALQKSNQGRHTFDNIHTLPVGISLQLPTREEILRVSESEIAQAFPAARSAVSTAKLPAASKTTDKAAKAAVNTPVNTQERLDQLASNQQQISEQLQHTNHKVDQLSDQVQTIQQQKQQQDQRLEHLSNQLADTGGRLQKLEQQSLQTVAPPPPPPAPVVRSTPVTPPPPVPPAADDTDWQWLAWLVAAVASLTALLSKGWHYFQERRQRTAANGHDAPTPTEAQPLIPLTEPATTLVPAVVTAVSLAGTQPPALPRTAQAGHHLSGQLEWQEEEEEEESIFKALLENPPTSPARS
ncbi:MAG: hypothetical protein HQM06_03380 [Magnetococcales bacterium]|nr:hypothetical protein [Magnetococcales bacterium]